jgi:hypothetical protein
MPDNSQATANLELTVRVRAFSGSVARNWLLAIVRLIAAYGNGVLAGLYASCLVAFGNVDRQRARVSSHTFFRP